MRCDIEAIDLIPIVSYIILRGKCRYCGQKSRSLHYCRNAERTAIPGGFPPVWADIVLVGWYIAMPAFDCFAFIDAEHRIIPDRFNIALAVAGLIMTISGEEAELMSRVIGIFAISVPSLQ